MAVDIGGHLVETRGARVAVEHAQAQTVFIQDFFDQPPDGSFLRPNLAVILLAQPQRVGVII